MERDWLERKDAFLTMDLRRVHIDMRPTILAKARTLKVGEGLHLIDTQEPTDLCYELADLGFEFRSIRAADDEVHIYLHRGEAR